MILYRKEPYPLQMKNIILLDDSKSEGVIYVSKNTYDQALILYNRFDGNVSRIQSSLISNATSGWSDVPGLADVITDMSESMPMPLNALAPFLMYCSKNYDITWNVENREQTYGVLHQYSQLIDFNAVTLVPTEIRNQVTFPTAILKQYEASWDDICSTLKEKVVQVPTQVVQQVVSAPTPVPVVQQAPVVAEAKPVEKVEEAKNDNADDSEEEEEMSPFQRRMMELAAKTKADREKHLEEEKNRAKNEPAKPSTPVKTEPAPQVLGQQQDRAKEANEVLDEFDC